MPTPLSENDVQLTRKTTTDSIFKNLKPIEPIKSSHQKIPDMDDPRYREGGIGFINFCQHFVRIPVYKKGDTYPIWTPMHSLPDEQWRPGVSYKSFWNFQCEVAKEALQMKDGLFKHKLIVLCYPRGDGKSFLATLMQIWKFMCWPAQQIMLGANSKDQIKFVHFDIIRDLILNSPFLLYRIGGKKHLQEKEIRRHIRNSSDEQRYNIIRAISSFSGIVSNITGYTFSEIFDMKNPKFFYQLDGSIRNIPNALGIIDSTVSAKGHVLHNLYEIYEERKDDSLFFSYRFSKTGIEADYWNPQMNQKQLDSYRVKFPPGEFARYFLNTWSSGSLAMFTPEQVEACYYLPHQQTHNDILTLIKEKNNALDQIVEIEKEPNEMSGELISDKYTTIKQIKHNLHPVSSLYTMDNALGICSLDDLNKIGNYYNTDFALLGGFDRSDPMAAHGARPVFALVAKGCKDSRAMTFTYKDPAALEYVYFLIGLVVIEPNTLKQMKDIVIRCNEIFDDLDAICSERWGMWDLAEWCEEQEIPYQAVHPTYDRQRTFFSELYTAVAKGNFKTPVTAVPGSKNQDILFEEMTYFVQDELTKWFGSPEKKSRHGVQDDVMYAIGHALYGGMTLTVEDFRMRHMSNPGFIFIPEKSVVGKY